MELNDLSNDFDSFSVVVRSKLVETFEIDENAEDLTLKEIESFCLSMEKCSKEQNEFVEILRQIDEFRFRLFSMKNLFVRSVFPDEFSSNENSFVSSKFFDEKSSISIDFENESETIYFSSLKFHSFSIRILDDDKSSLKYFFEEKFSRLYHFELDRLVTSIDRLVIGIPLFPLDDRFEKVQTNKFSSQRFFVRIRSSCQNDFRSTNIIVVLDRRFQRVFYRSVRLESFDEKFYAIFSLDETFSSFDVEILLCFPFENVKTFVNDDSSSNFRLETSTNVLCRQMPMNLSRFEQKNLILSSSDLFEFQWEKHFSTSNDFRLTISLTKHSNRENQTKNSSIRREKPSKKTFDEIEEFSPKFVDFSPSNRFEIDHFPTLKNFSDETSTSNKFSTSDETNFSTKKTFKWKFDRFEDEISPILLFTSNNRKWKNSTNLVSIKSTNQKDLFNIDFVRKTDRIEISSLHFSFRRKIRSID